MSSSFGWRSAAYADWNARLVEHVFGGFPRPDEVSHIPASPEELCAVAEDTTATSDEVVGAFVSAVRDALPVGCSFCRFCAQREGWTPKSREPPHFFGMLWFTCLVAAGYGDDHGSFAERFTALIGKSDNLRDPQGECLNELWEDVAEWSAAQATLPTLTLPPEDGWRSVIGRSYYLAMPNRADRQALRTVLVDADLVGLDPPLFPVLSALEANLDRLSRDFRAAFEYFRSTCVAGSRAPWDSPFWRAIRHEAKEGLLTDAEHAAEATRLTLVATWDPDEALQLFLACGAEPGLEGFRTVPSDLHFDDLPFALTDDSGDANGPVRALLAGRVSSRRGLDTMVNRGVLAFREAVTNEYRLAAGEEIEGADLALVRSDRLSSFIATFGGDPEPSYFSGWSEVVGCSVRQVQQLPDGLRGVQHLLPTSRAPRPYLIGGVRYGATYLSILLPQIKAPGAARVEWRTADAWRLCLRTPDVGIWRLPSAPARVTEGRVTIRACYQVQVGDRTTERFAEIELRLSEGITGWAYKPAGSGDYWRECAQVEEELVTGGSAVPLDMCTSDPDECADLLDFAPSKHFLGTARGAVARERESDSAWMAVGRPGAPHLLLHLGSAEEPLLPSARQCRSSRNRRLWRRSFRAAPQLVVAVRQSAYVASNEDRELAAVHQAYARAAADTSTPLDECGEADEGFESDADPVPGLIAPADPAVALVEAVSAMGMRRSGIPLREVQNILVDLLTEGPHHEGEIFHLGSQIVRAWAESGAIDLLRSVGRSQTLVVPRPPRLIAIHRGPQTDVTLIGLAPPLLAESLAQRLDGQAVSLRPSTAFQPPLFRFLGCSPDSVQRVAADLGLPAEEWLHWPRSDGVPVQLQVKTTYDGMRHAQPPPEYEYHATWNWDRGAFERNPGLRRRELVEVERRRHPRHCAIFVVLLDGEDMCWGHMRSWALLRAFELKEVSPFRLAEGPVVKSTGANPVHLPLPFGRFCAIAGAALPGPRASPEGGVADYEYPYGRGTWELARAALPDTWLDLKESI